MQSKILNAVIFVVFLGAAYIIWTSLDMAEDKSIASLPKDEAGRSLELGTARKSKSGLIESNVIMNDPAMSQKWGLQKMQAKKAWDVSQGSRDITIAVIDTGIDINHKDLKKNLWINRGEYGIDPKTGKNRATDGIDNDQNGCIDDVHGIAIMASQFGYKVGICIYSDPLRNGISQE